MLEIRKSMDYVDVFTNPCSMTLQTFSFSIYINLNLTKSLIVNIQNSFELLHIFQLFYYLHCRLPLTSGLLPVPDEETPPDV